jgi:2-polyprenyl-3-methyl-5-hydroxy-6-metoxy-1,4-benzoquinol methylase
MPSSEYSEFTWRGVGPGNGRSGENVANCLLTLVTKLDDIQRICDLGCGNGYLSGRLAALGYEVTGVDASETGIALARESYSNAVFIHSLMDENLGEVLGCESFDLVISSDVIEHLYRPSDLLEAAAELLRPSGHLVLGTPYHGYLKNLALSVTGKMDSHFNVLDDGGHIKFFSVNTLSTLVEKHSFTNLKFSFSGRVPGLWKNMTCHARKKPSSKST